MLTLISLPPLLSTMISPAAAQEQEWSDNDMNDGDLRDFLRDAVRERADRRDMLMDLIQERRDRRAELMDMLRDRRDLRDRIRERVSGRLGGEDDDGNWGGRLRERLAARAGGNCYFLTRSLRDEDGSLLVIVRRRVCRD